MTSMLTSCWSLQISYQKALAAVFVEGCIFILLAMTGAPFQSLEIDPFLPLNATWVSMHHVLQLLLVSAGGTARSMQMQS